MRKGHMIGRERGWAADDDSPLNMLANINLTYSHTCLSSLIHTSKVHLLGLLNRPWHAREPAAGATVCCRTSSSSSSSGRPQRLRETCKAGLPTCLKLQAVRLQAEISEVRFGQSTREMRADLDLTWIIYARGHKSAGIMKLGDA
jgi:hypothetical protein